MCTGYITAWICKINTYIIKGVEGVAVVLLIQDLIFMVLIIIWKIKFPRLEAKGALKVHEEPMRKVLSLKQLDSSKDYCVFANYIYAL
jgi:hypothetical protein